MDSRGVSGAQLKLWAVAVFAISMLVVGVAWQLVRDRAAEMDAAERSAVQMALALEASTSGTLHSAELITHHVATIALANLDAEGLPTGDAVSQWHAILSGNTFLHAVGFIQPDGIAPLSVMRRRDGSIWTNRDALDLSRWSGFNVDATSPYITDPRRSDFTGRWLISLTLPLRDAQGSVHGIVYANIAVDTFSDLFSEVLPDDNSSVTLFRTDGRLLFGDPLVEQTVGESMAHLGLFTKHFANSPTGTYDAIAPRVGDRRVLSYRKIAGWPLLLTVDFPFSEILAAWNQRAVFYVLAALTASTVILTLTVWLSLQFRRDGANRRTLLLRERSLEKSQRLAGVGHFERDIVTGVIVWAENMYAIHGVSPETFNPSQDSFLDLVVADSRATATDRVIHLDAPPENGHLECKVLRPDDQSIRDMIYDWEVIRDQDGNPIKSFGVARDVTDLKATEGKARDNEERLQDITECMSDFIWETDQDGVLTYFDTGSGELTIDVEIGVTKDENIDTSEGEGDRSFMNRAMARQESFRNLTFALRNKKNEVRWVRVSANPRFDQDDLFIGFRGAGTDITEQRRERIVENEKYKSDALDRLAGGMAHEINNLLQPVVVYSSMGESEVPQLERTQGYFRKIFTASQQAISIVQDILTFAREQRVKPEPVCLATAISEGLDIIRPTLPTALRLSELGADVSLNVAANVGGLHQVLFNLIGNAVDAVGPEGIVSIDAGSVVLYPRDAELWSILPGRYGYFSVTDDGIGMDEQNLSKVFDPFFTTKPHGTGTGLGLSVVAGLVREWGGAVDVQSKPGETVFTVYMPLVHTERQAAE